MAKLLAEVDVLKASRDETAARLARSEARASALEEKLQEAKQRLAELAKELQARTREASELAQKAKATEAEAAKMRGELAQTRDMLALKTKVRVGLRRCEGGVTSGLIAACADGFSLSNVLNMRIDNITFTETYTFAHSRVRFRVRVRNILPWSTISG